MVAAMLETIPGGPGAYVLEILLDRPLAFAAARLRGTLPAGTYAYAGSAHGAGGLRARIARHLRRDKPIHWHADRLTTAGRVTGVAFAETVSECELARILAALPGATIPLAGFGSSDCRQCAAHLIRLGEGVPLASAVTEPAALRYLDLPATAPETPS
jgi:Uri superfamily endonuclease